MASKRVLWVLLLVAAAAVLFAVLKQLRERQHEAETAVQNIDDQLDALDPATRAAVVAEVASEEVERVRDRRS